MAAAISEVEGEADHQPYDETQPGLPRQEYHQQEREGDAEDGYKRHAGCAERAGDLYVSALAVCILLRTDRAMSRRTPVRLLLDRLDSTTHLKHGSTIALALSRGDKMTPPAKFAAVTAVAMFGALA